MTDSATYQNRRRGLRSVAEKGAVLLVGTADAPRNYPANPYPHRQDSHVLYFSGLVRPEIAILIESDGETLFGHPEDLDDVIWHGPHPSLDDEASAAGFARVRPVAELGEAVSAIRAAGGEIHYLAPYRHEQMIRLAGLLGTDVATAKSGASQTLAHAVADLRNNKSADEVAEIDEALSVTARMFEAAMKATRAGVREADIAGAAQGVALAADRQQAYHPIITVRGEVLHNHDHSNVLENGQLLLDDSGAESTGFYASDITRTWPVNGKFSDEQRAVYDVCLRSQLAAIDMARPGVSYRDVHLHASKVITEGLTDLGLMKGNADDAVAAGAHALFFPHGLGHMLGLDVHDMEDLGEDIVGYLPDQKRSDQFGLGYLRLARPLEAGFVFTVEPGIYFIPALIDRWSGEGRHVDFIDYDAVNRLRGLGGVRIEDDVLCTDEGARVLGPGIPKTIDEVEAVLAS